MPRNDRRQVVALATENKRLREENEELRRKLSERIHVARAKGIMMQMHGWSEERAYRWLRDTSMQRNVRMGLLARQIVMAHALAADDAA